MRLWRWPRHPEDTAARRAAEETEQALQEEQARLDEATELARRLAAHRHRNRFAEAMKIAFGGKP